MSNVTRRGRALGAAVLALLFAPALAFAQATGTLTGTVVDGDFGGGLPGASVLVVELGVGAATDIDGNYTVRQVPTGTYTVRYSFTGYGTQTVENVAVAAGEPVVLNVTLAPGAELAEVVVEAEEILQTNSEVGLLRVRAKAAQVSDAISAEAISQSGASDAGDAMERVTGASVQGGRYVYVRGLGDRYAATQLNGSTLPTADPDRRAVQFDLFPSAFLENIVTLKTFTPDKPGNFSGGLVDINTRSFPLGLTASFSASSGASSQVIPGDAILVDPASDVSYLGTAGNLGALPEALLDGREFPFVSNQEIFNPDTEEGRERMAAIQANEALVDYFGTRSVAPQEGTAAQNLSLSGSVGNSVRLWGNDLGFILGGTLNRGVGSYDEGTVGRYDTAGPGGEPRLRQRRRDQRSTVESSVGGIASVSYRLGAAHELTANTLFSRSAESEGRVIAGLAPIPIGGVGDEITVTDRVVGYTERQLGSAQLRGRHQLAALAGLEAEWRASYAATAIDEPDLRFFANAQFEDGGLAVGGASLNNTLHFFRESTEDLGGLALDLTVPPRALGGVQVKVGGLYERTARDFRERRFEILSQGLSLGGQDAAAVETFFSPENSGVVDVRAPNPRDPRQRSTFVIGNRLVDNTQANNQYDGGLDVTAGYAMVELPVLPRLRAIGGVRYERTDLSIDVVDRVTGLAVAPEDSTLSGRIGETDWLPSLNLVYNVARDMNLRAAATRTLARPTFREIAPFCSFNFATDGPLCGNPALDRTLITNLDLRWEWFNRPGSLVALSGYYKHLDRPIELAIIDNENGLQEYQNVDRATIVGAEVEVRQGLDAVTALPVVRDLSLGGNLTLTRSEITISEDELAERRLVDPDAAGTRALQGQSPYLVNLDLSYDTETTSAGLFFNVFGRRLARVGIPDVYERPSPQLDFVASRQVLGQFKVKLAVKNVFGEGVEQVYDFPASTLGAIGGDTPVYQAYSRGTSFSLGLSFSPRFRGGSPAVPAVPSPTSPPLSE